MKLKYIPTGIVFELPELDAVKYFKSDRGNYQILDENFVDDVKEVVETTTYDKVVQKEKPKTKAKAKKKVVEE